MNRKKETGTDESERAQGASGSGTSAAGKEGRPKNGGWQKIEALRERAALKASLADVWDEDFDLDDEILADLDHTAEFFTTQEDPDEEIPGDDDGDDIDEYYDDDEV